MRKIVTFFFLLTALFLKAQKSYEGEGLPVFKQVTHPFMPPITSSYFSFSEDGLLWFSTAQGLTSFDGSDVVFHSSVRQTNDWGLAQIRAVQEDHQHNFYIGTSVGYYYYDRSLRSYTPLYYTFLDSHRQISPAIMTIYLDKKTGLLYAGCGNGGMFIYDPVSKHMDHYNLDATKPDSWQDRRMNTVVSFASHATDSNKIWVGTYHGIYMFDKKARKFYQDFEIVTNITHKYIPASSGKGSKQMIDVSLMDVANDSIIWFNSWAGGFAKYNSKTGKVAIVFGRDAIYKAKDLYYGYLISRFVKLKNEKYLLGIYSGKTAVYDTKTNTAEYFNVTGINYPEEETKYATLDNNGNIWLLQKGFLYVTIPGKFRLQNKVIPQFTTHNSQLPKVRGAYFDTVSHLFYAAFLGATGVHVYDTNFMLQAIIPTTVINNYYNYGSTNDSKIAKDSSGRFWVTGWKVHVKLPAEKKFTPVENKYHTLAWLGREDIFNDITATKNGNILVEKNDGTIYHINHLTLQTDTIHCPEMKAAGVEIKSASTWYDEKRDLVYLICREGIAQYNIGNHQMKCITYQALFGALPPNQGVCMPTLDATGRLWLMIPKFGIRVIDPVSLACTDSIAYGSKGLMRGDYTTFVGGSGNYILFRSQNGVVVYDFLKRRSFLFDRSNGLSSPDNKSFLYCNGNMIIGQSGLFEYFKLSNLDNNSSNITPYLNNVMADTATVFMRTGLGKENTIRLSHDQNTLTFSFSVPEFFFPERIEYAYQLLPVDKDWHYTNNFNRRIIYTKLAPGKYTFLLRSQMQGGNWSVNPVEYSIIIVPAWWQTIVFKVCCGVVMLGLFFYFNNRRIKAIRKKEQQKSVHEKELMELEAKALRAQMNPHFIFNCLNSIKSLIQQHEEEKSVTYLTTFSKLIRTLFNNADKKSISLFDEIETCRYYLQLEAMRFDSKFSYSVKTDPEIDLKSIEVPALIIQPFIENAIWHGIVPHDNVGQVAVSVGRKNDCIEVIIDDDGIGRESSQQNKYVSNLAHQSKGVNLTQSRLELNNLLQQRKAQLEIIDKKNENGAAAGTTVIIKIKEEIS